MKLTTSLLLLLVWVAFINGRAQSITEKPEGFGYEILLAKIEFVYQKLIELQMETTQQRDTNREFMQEIKSTMEHVNASCVYSRSRSVKSIAPVPSCKDNESAESGPYWPTMPSSTRYQIYCQQSLYGGGWIVFQRRTNGVVNFYRNWEAYKNGFGVLSSEFWIGLERMHSLTSSGEYELIVHLMDFRNVVKYAKYDRFAIGNESEKYALKTLGSHSGTMGDSLSPFVGQKFSTLDQDNDGLAGENRAISHQGGWWYGEQNASNLNGWYRNKASVESMFWYEFHSNHQGMKHSLMMIREVL